MQKIIARKFVVRFERYYENDLYYPFCMHISLYKSIILHLLVQIFLKSIEKAILLFSLSSSLFLQKKERGVKRWQNFLYQAPSKEAKGSFLTS